MEIWIRRSYEFDCPRTKLNFSRSIAQFAQVDKDVKLSRLYLWLTDRLTHEVIVMMRSSYTCNDFPIPSFLFIHFFTWMALLRKQFYRRPPDNLRISTDQLDNVNKDCDCDCHIKLRKIPEFGSLEEVRSLSHQSTSMYN